MASVSQSHPHILSLSLVQGSYKHHMAQHRYEKLRSLRMSHCLNVAAQTTAAGQAAGTCVKGTGPRAQHPARPRQRKHAHQLGRPRYAAPAQLRAGSRCAAVCGRPWQPPHPERAAAARASGTSAAARARGTGVPAVPPDVKACRGSQANDQRPMHAGRAFTSACLSTPASV